MQKEVKTRFVSPSLDLLSLDLPLFPFRSLSLSLSHPFPSVVFQRHGIEMSLCSKGGLLWDRLIKDSLAITSVSNKKETREGSRCQQLLSQGRSLQFFFLSTLTFRVYQAHQDGDDISVQLLAVLAVLRP